MGCTKVLTDNISFKSFSFFIIIFFGIYLELEVISNIALYQQLQIYKHGIQLRISKATIAKNFEILHVLFESQFENIFKYNFKLLFKIL
uniref:Transmembrane protein n=1 Tax=Strigamia maritima TaxID=126957 RepID=T1IYQ9_STRMM